MNRMSHGYNNTAGTAVGKNMGGNGNNANVDFDHNFLSSNCNSNYNTIRYEIQYFI